MMETAATPEMKPCPFCKSDKLDLSLSSGNNCYYKQVYCKHCHCYGPRVRIAVKDCNYHNRFKWEDDEESTKLAITLWNMR